MDRKLLEENIKLDINIKNLLEEGFSIEKISTIRKIQKM